jgi:hypothetical protein
VEWIGMGDFLEDRDRFRTVGLVKGVGAKYFAGLVGARLSLVDQQRARSSFLCTKSLDEHGRAWIVRAEGSKIAPGRKAPTGETFRHSPAATRGMLVRF